MSVDCPSIVQKFGEQYLKESEDARMEMEKAIDILWQSIQNGIHDPEALRGKFSIDDAYRVQLGMLARHEECGRRFAGWKVGLTAKVIQEQMGFHEPVFGYLLQSGCRSSGVDIEYNSLISPGFENELCLLLDHTLAGPNVSFEQAKRAVSKSRPALEIVEKRSRLPRDFPLALADNGKQKAFVVGDEVALEDTDLAKVVVEVSVNDVAQEQARGDAVLGTPIASMHWLANKLAQYDRVLDAGSLIMSGSFTKQYDIASGDHVVANFDQIGEVHARFP